MPGFLIHRIFVVSAPAGATNLRGFRLFAMFLQNDAYPPNWGYDGVSVTGYRLSYPLNEARKTPAYDNFPVVHRSPAVPSFGLLPQAPGPR